MDSDEVMAPLSEDDAAAVDAQAAEVVAHVEPSWDEEEDDLHDLEGTGVFVDHAGDV